jgi:Protein of unknown function (DUF429)
MLCVLAALGLEWQSVVCHRSNWVAYDSNVTSPSNVFAKAVAVGIDVGADRLHVVVLARDLELVCVHVISPSAIHTELDSLFAALPIGASVAIDGPPFPSMQPFRNDLTVSTKFRKARGCEVVLGREHGIWVSFATGPEPLEGWMAVAARVHATANANHHVALETYPHAIYRKLIGARPAKKTTANGITERVGALSKRGLVESTLPMWSHDALDAAAAAIVAADHHNGTATRAYCSLDDTSIWLPAPDVPQKPHHSSAEATSLIDNPRMALDSARTKPVFERTNHETVDDAKSAIRISSTLRAK